MVYYLQYKTDRGSVRCPYVRAYSKEKLIQYYAEELDGMKEYKIGRSEENSCIISWGVWSAPLPVDEFKKYVERYL